MKNIDEMKKSIFSIVLRTVENKIIHLGTGFFIGKDGIFFTVGHVFRKVEEEIIKNSYENIFISFPSNESVLYTIIDIWYESKDVYDQRGPTYKDTAVGKSVYKNDEYLILNRKRPKLKEDLVLYGYHNIGQDIYHEINNNDRVNLSNVVFNQIPMTVEAYDSLISFFPIDYKLSKEKVSKRKILNNCLKLDKKAIIGESGSPIIDSLGLVSGILIGSIKDFNTSDMILSKYCTKIIKYRTKHKINIYKDLEYRLKM